MHTVYVLQSQKDGNLYIGCTSDIKNRLKEHENGLVQSTKSRRPLDLVFTENFEDKYTAFIAERNYKTAKGKKELKEKMKKHTKTT